jgi:hypothetical protein
MSIDSKIIGAYRRSGLLLEGKRFVDFSDVLWIQTPECYVDIRYPISPDLVTPTDGVPEWFYGTFSFGGTASWDGTKITWNHLIDTDPTGAIDSNPLVWDDGVVLENGTTELGEKTDVPFTEEWLRITQLDDPWSATHEDGYIRVEVGRHAIEIHDERPTGACVATRFVKDGDGWKPVGQVSAA